LDRGRHCSVAAGVWLVLGSRAGAAAGAEDVAAGAPPGREVTLSGRGGTRGAYEVAESGVVVGGGGTTACGAVRRCECGLVLEEGEGLRVGAGLEEPRG
jgi:hypothetical protein